MASSSCSRPGFVSRWRRRRSPSFNGDFGLEDLFLEQVGSSEPEEFEEDEVCFEPLFDDEIFEPVRNAESLKREEEEKKREEEKRKKREEEETKRKAEETKRRAEERVWRRKKHAAVIKLIRKYDPKAKSLVWTRFPFEDFGYFDIDEESTICPMRNTNKKYLPTLWAANILTIKIVSSDVGFPIDVYGTVIARDYLDWKCVYLFRCHRRDSQLIDSEDESLILIGPARGLVLLDFIYLELDLKIKGVRGQDKQLSKGLLEIDGRKVTRMEKIKVMQITCASWLSTMEVKYTAVQDAVEATVEIRVLWGYFRGQISAHTNSILDEFVLYKGETGGVFTSDGTRIIPLWRRVVNVCLTDKLFFTLQSKHGTKMIIESTPAPHGSDCYECPFGSEKFLVKVTWSVTEITDIIWPC